MQTTRSFWKKSGALSAVIVAGLALFGGLFALIHDGPAALQAAPLATWYVDGALGNDGSSCSAPGASACATIAGALAKAASGDTIEVADGTYFEHSIDIFDDVTIQGESASGTVIDGDFQGRVLRNYGEVTIRNLTIQNGRIFTTSSITFDQAGAGIFNSGDLTMQSVILTNNEAQGSGGAIYNIGSLQLEDSNLVSNTAAIGGGLFVNSFAGDTLISTTIISGNTAIGIQGGGIYNSAPITLTDSLVINNSAVNSGGGLVAYDHAVIERTTFTGNQADAGAGIMSQAGTAELTNVTVSGNIARNNYGGIYLTGPTVAFTITSSTIAANERLGTAGTSYNGLMLGNQAAVTLVNTLFAGNEGRNCGGTNGSWTSLGYNLSSDFHCQLTGTGDVQGVDPQLGPLTEVSDYLFVHQLTAGSPAVDSGTNGSCPAVDQRGVSRPVDGDNDGTATCDIGAFELTPQLAIADLTILEGNSGATTASFTVTLSPTSTQVVTVFASTSDGSATSGSDYTAISSQPLVFNPGESTQFATVDVLGDTDDESDETFAVRLTGAVNAEYFDREATGTIVDDDGLPSLTIGDVTVAEGNSGTEAAVFTVALSPAAPGPVTVDVATADGSATAGEDYTAVNQQLTFDPGQTAKTVTVLVNGDGIDEGVSESFTVSLSGASGAAVADGAATGTIIDDETAQLRHEIGPQVVEGDSGTTTANFTVTLTGPAAFVITVDYTIREGFGDDGAKFGSDLSGPYTGTLTFQPGDTLKTYPVNIVGDTDPEADEMFSSLISNASAPIAGNGSLATILNDDAVDFPAFLPIVIR